MDEKPPVGKRLREESKEEMHGKQTKLWFDKPCRRKIALLGRGINVAISGPRGLVMGKN